MGTCTGVTSLCSIGGFALESRCHNGQVILYDTVQMLGWSVNIRNHLIKTVVDRLFADDADWKAEFNGEIDDGGKDGNGWFSTLGWGWRRKPDEGPEGGDEPKRPMREVPLARPANEVEGADGVCTVRPPLFFLCVSLRLNPSRTALVGNLEVSRIVPNL